MMNFSELKNKKSILLMLLIVVFLLAGCGNKLKAEAPPGETQAGKQAAQAEAKKETKPGPASGGKALAAKEAVALAEASAKKELGEQVDIVKVYGNQKGTTVNGRATNWQIMFANPARKTLVVEIENGQISQVRDCPADEPLKEAAGGKWIDSVKAAEAAQAGGGASFKHTVANPSVSYTLGRLSEIAWYGDKKAGVVGQNDQRPAWRISYDNQDHYYVDALSGTLIAKGSYHNRP